ncbi:MAG TPA: hypothetical protein VKA15_05160, partial [Isosphaeraceae bacterium]|nr:hypothetical protein [Isosphaeraceae bacterium]
AIATVNGNTAAGKAAAAGAHTSGSGAGGSGAGGGGVDPSVALTGTSPLAGTGSNPAPLVAIGVVLVAAGWFGRRRLQGHRRDGRPS